MHRHAHVPSQRKAPKQTLLGVLAPRKHQEILFFVQTPLDWYWIFSRANDPRLAREIEFFRQTALDWHECNTRANDPPEQRKRLYTRGFLLWNVAKAACGEWEKCAWAQGLDTANSPLSIASESLQEVGAPPK